MSERDKRRVNGAIKLSRQLMLDSNPVLNCINNVCKFFNWSFGFFGNQQKTLEIFSSVFLVEDVNTFPNRYSHSRVAQNR